MRQPSIPEAGPTEIGDSKQPGFVKFFDVSRKADRPGYDYYERFHNWMASRDGRDGTTEAGNTEHSTQYFDWNRERQLVKAGHNSRWDRLAGDPRDPRNGSFSLSAPSIDDFAATSDRRDSIGQSYKAILGLKQSANIEDWVAETQATHRMSQSFLCPPGANVSPQRLSDALGADAVDGLAVRPTDWGSCALNGTEMEVDGNKLNALQCQYTDDPTGQKQQQQYQAQLQQQQQMMQQQQQPRQMQEQQQQQQQPFMQMHQQRLQHQQSQQSQQQPMDQTPQSGQFPPFGNQLQMQQQQLEQQHRELEQQQFQQQQMHLQQQQQHAQQFKKYQQQQQQAQQQQLLKLKAQEQEILQQRKSLQEKQQQRQVEIQRQQKQKQQLFLQQQAHQRQLKLRQQKQQQILQQQQLHNQHLAKVQLGRRQTQLLHQQQHQRRQLQQQQQLRSLQDTVGQGFDAGQTGAVAFNGRNWPQWNGGMANGQGPAQFPNPMSGQAPGNNMELQQRGMNDATGMEGTAWGNADDMLRRETGGNRGQMTPSVDHMNGGQGNGWIAANQVRCPRIPLNK